MKIDELSTNKETLEVLFNSNNKFIVPAYQRPYEWKTDQVEKLLDNICEAYSSNKSNKSNENDIFVLGTVQFKIRDKNYNIKEIIDGHQRITTLYLLKKYLGSQPSFSYYNEINNSKSIDDLIENENLYKSNFTFIDKFFSKGDANKINRKEFVDFLNKKIVFISISVIGDNVSVDDTLKLFDSLNTTGLSLQVKDIFKISFSDYLAKNSDAKNKADTIRNINKAYDQVVNPIDYSKEEKENKYDSIYALDETDLLDSYRFYLISQMKDVSWSVQFRQSNSAFF